MDRKLHLMWDLETQDTVPSAIVVSIGACVFDPNSDFIAEQTFYDTPNREVQELRGPYVVRVHHALVVRTVRRSASGVQRTAGRSAPRAREPG